MPPLPEPVPSPPAYRPRWLLLVGLWTLVGLAFVLHYFAIHLSEDIPFEHGRALWTLLGWYIWIPLTPLVMALARRFPVAHPHWVRRVALHVAIAFVLSILEVGFYTALQAGISLLRDEASYDVVRYFRLALYRSVFFDLLVYACIIAVTYARDTDQKYRHRDLKLAHLETQLAEAQLHVLRMQLNPHFLFNTLHTISAIMDENVKAARRLMADLSDLLRQSLDNIREQLVPLRQELDFLRTYLRIEQERFQERLTVSMEVDDEALRALVPNLVLQPLVENAIKHGIAPFASGGRIVIRAVRRGTSLCLQVEDDGPGLPAGQTAGALLGTNGAANGTSASRHGLGLRTTYERLAYLYGGEFDFRLENGPAGGLVVTLTLPFCTEVLESIA